MRTFAQWLPVSNAPWEQYRIGDLATLFRIETRYTARDRPLDVRTGLAGASDRKGALLRENGCRMASLPHGRRTSWLPILR